VKKVARRAQDCLPASPMTMRGVEKWMMEFETAADVA